MSERFQIRTATRRAEVIAFDASDAPIAEFVQMALEGHVRDLDRLLIAGRPAAARPFGAAVPDETDPDFYIVRVDHFAAGSSVARIARQDLLSLYLRARDLHLALSPWWLMCRDPLGWEPSAADQERARTLEAAIAAARVPDAPDLLAALDEGGIFEIRFSHERAAALVVWGLTDLQRYQKAGLALLDYLFSPERAAVLTPPPFVGAVIDSPVSISVFLDPATPWPPAHRHSWLANLEKARPGADGAGRRREPIKRIPPDGSPV